MRMDKWLWAVRLYKTRSLAAAACTNGRVLVDDVPVKPARTVRVGELIRAVCGDLQRTVKVIGLTEHRVGAPLVSEYLEDLTPPEEREKARLNRPPPGFIPRPKGAGRPTKKDRRAFDQFTSEEAPGSASNAWQEEGR